MVVTVISTKAKFVMTLAVTIGVLALTYFLFPTADVQPVPPDNGDTQIDMPDEPGDSQPEPELEHDSSDDHGCEGLDHGEGKKVGLHERCDD